MSLALVLTSWYKYRLLAGASPPRPFVNNPFVEADVYFRNLLGWQAGLLVLSLLQFSVWLADMRDVAETLWPEGQRRRRAWLVFGWVLPVVQLFVPKMFVNDLWAASRPEGRRRRGHPLLTAWWLAVLAAANAYGHAVDDLKKAADVDQARHALRQLMIGESLHICAVVLSVTVVWQLVRRLERAKAEASVEVPLVGNGASALG
ncbi:DUF4328 domain-containing protein [Streptomyces sp. NPDC059618]|uniref:DUF4328 domain-containing protein n=1 Tax=Streptomyces sp. NPDC059618 TaxID=3346887 RepID=UPI0036AFB9A5